MIRAEALSRRGKRLLREALGGAFDAAFRRGSPAAGRLRTVKKVG